MPKRRFNRSFQNKSTQAVLAAGGGHQLAAEALGSVPEAWRERLSIAQIVQGYYRPRKPGKNVRRNVRPKSLKSMQLELFPTHFCPPNAAVKVGKIDPDRPLADLLPPDFYP